MGLCCLCLFDAVPYHHSDVRRSLHSYSNYKKASQKRTAEKSTEKIHDLKYSAHSKNLTSHIVNMPRNGDGSSDNGPIEGQNIIHGASGDVSTRRPLMLLRGLA